MKVMRSLIPAALFATGALFALYGVFALIYQGDGSGATYVKLAGTEMNAHLAGALSLALAAVFLGSGVLLTARLRRIVR